MRIFTLTFFIAICFQATSQDLLNYVDFAESFPHNAASKVEKLPNGDFIHFDFLTDNIDIDPGPGVYMVDGSITNGIVLSRYTASGDLVWSNFFPSGNYYLGDMRVSPTGEILITSNFSGTLDFDPGAGEVILGDENSMNSIFVCKFSLEGALIWARTILDYDAFTPIVVYAMTTDLDGSAILGGYFAGTVDFDPGAGEELRTSLDSDTDAFLLKLNSDGDFVFVNTNGGEMYDYFLELNTDLDGNVVATGVTRVSADLDPGAGEFIVSTEDDYEIGYVVKYNALGEFIWGFELTTNASAGIHTDVLNIDNSGNVLLTGMVYGLIDFDPGVSETFGGSLDDSIYWYIVKYSPAGELIWLKWDAGLTPLCAAVDADGNLYTSGASTWEGDMDGGIGVANAGSEFDNTTMYCAKYNSDGDYVWGFGLAGNDFVGGSWSTDLTIDSDNNVVIAGLYQSNLDLNPGIEVDAVSAIVNAWPLFVATYGQGVCANTSLVITAAENLSCGDYDGLITAEYNNGVEPLSYQWSSGESSTTILPIYPGIYTVYATDGNGCEDERDVLINGPSSPDNYDLNPHAVAWNFVPGFSTYIMLDGFNQGCGYATGSLILTLDPALSLLDVNPPADNINGNVITWNFSDINYDSDHITPTILVSTPEETPLGDIMNLAVEMSPSIGDYDASNNIKTYAYEVVGSYDPNIIEVSPVGLGEEGYVNANETMTYTIHFQNTGTAPAVNVNVLNAIDPDLDINTVQVLASSHPMHTEIENGNELRFVFNNIMLEDSTTNEPESHGYVVYTIEQQPNLPYFTQMENTAAIYFDFNAPVITNTVLNTILGPVTVDESNEANPLQLFPSPATSELSIVCKNSRDNFVQIISMDGRVVDSFRTTQHQITYDVSELPAGIYSVRLAEASGKTHNGRFMKK